MDARKGRRAQGGSARRWDEASLFAELDEKCGPNDVRAARDLYEWTIQRGWRPTFGAGRVDGSWVPVVDTGNGEHYPIALYTYGRIEVQFQHLKARAPFDEEQTRRELLERVNRIPCVAFGDEVISKRPSIPLSLLAGDPATLAELKRTLEWVEQAAATPSL